MATHVADPEEIEIAALKTKVAELEDKLKGVQSELTELKQRGFKASGPKSTK